MIQAVINGIYSAEQATLEFGIRNTLNETEICQDTAKPKTEEERLKRRILELEAENTYLKKLRELLLEEERQQKQSKS